MFGFFHQGLSILPIAVSTSRTSASISMTVMRRQMRAAMVAGATSAAAH